MLRAISTRQLNSVRVNIRVAALMQRDQHDLVTWRMTVLPWIDGAHELFAACEAIGAEGVIARRLDNSLPAGQEEPGRRQAEVPRVGARSRRPAQAAGAEDDPPGPGGAPVN